MSSGKSTTVGYRVEARQTQRHTQREPLEIGGVFLSESWRHIEATKAPLGTGVPNHQWDPRAAEFGILTYATAKALVAWAAAALGWHGADAEFRLVRVRFVSTWEESEEGVGLPFRFDALEKAEAFSPRETPSAPSTTADSRAEGGE